MSIFSRRQRDLRDMQVANRAAWVKALLSGEYAQGHGVLKTTNNEWCCLGVAGNVLEPTLDVLVKGEGFSYLPYDWAKDKLGITSRGDAGYVSTPDQVKAANWNDRSRYSFAQIADRVAMATEQKKPFADADYAKLIDKPSGDYAREWMSRQSDR